MFRLIEGILGASQLGELNRIADAARFVDGRITNPHNIAKQNLHIHDPQPQQAAARMMAEALLGSEEFRDVAFPKEIAPPLITAYRADMRYGLHADAAYMRIGQRSIRSDLSCTIFLSEPARYDGGALRIQLGSSSVEVKGPAGSAIVYPSTTLHEVTPVVRGERRVGLTFIQSRVADSEKREWLYELNEVAALEGLKMSHENFSRLQRIQQNLLRAWGDSD